MIFAKSDTAGKPIRFQNAICLVFTKLLRERWMSQEKHDHYKAYIGFHILFVLVKKGKIYALLSKVFIKFAEFLLFKEALKRNGLK